MTWRDDAQVYGHLCFWASGERLGDFDQSVMLSAAARYLREFLSHSAERHVEALDGKLAEEVFAYVSETVYYSEGAEKSRDPVARYVPKHLLYDWALHGRLRAAFHLDDVGDATFQGMSMILFDDHSLGVQRLIWRYHGANDLHEARLPDHVFDAVAEQFLAAYEQDTGESSVK